eukprot:TRINITY_DN11137_c0_g1_i1.p1 TRINITY_DN11137_c0_g1~~TRINITY_DN11137_c0_g1_i1.p1  ORF type:complete len:350 (-),score=62.26 TRINITY_DN11137_c0_g1_i1:433-1482(-)
MSIKPSISIIMPSTLLSSSLSCSSFVLLALVASSCLLPLTNAIQFPTRQRLLDFYTLFGATPTEQTFAAPLDYTKDGYSFFVPTSNTEICGPGFVRVVPAYRAPVTIAFRPPKYPTSFGLDVGATYDAASCTLIGGTSVTVSINGRVTGSSSSFFGWAGDEAIQTITVSFVGNLQRQPGFSNLVIQGSTNAATTSAQNVLTTSAFFSSTSTSALNSATTSVQAMATSNALLSLTVDAAVSSATAGQNAATSSANVLTTSVLNSATTQALNDATASLFSTSTLNVITTDAFDIATTSAQIASTTSSTAFNSATTSALAVATSNSILDDHRSKKRIQRAQGDDPEDADRCE